MSTVEPGALRLVLVGAGGMGRVWLELLAATPSVDVVGVVDLDEELAASAATAHGLDVVVGRDLTEVARRADAGAVVNVTVPAAHHAVTTEALRAGLPVLSEKPLAPTVAEALSLVAASESSGRLVMVSQSRRYLASLHAFRDAARTLGPLGLASTRFSLAPRFGGFRDAMDHPLLVDMAIHSFDTARYLLAADPVAVYCESSNPHWSWYAGDAAATAVFEMAGGARFTYTGSWCSEGFETSWNGDWTVTGARGSAHWDGEQQPELERPGEPRAVADQRPGGRESIGGALDEFVRALSSGVRPSGEVHENVYSLAMVEAAVRSADTGARVRVEDVLEEAFRTAVAGETDAAVRERLVGWGSARAGLAGTTTATAPG